MNNNKIPEKRSRRDVLKTSAAVGVAVTGVGAAAGSASAQGQNIEVDASQIFSDSLVVVNLNNIDVDVIDDVTVVLRNIDVNVDVIERSLNNNVLTLTVQDIDVSLIERSVVNVLVTVLGTSAVGQTFQRRGTDQVQVPSQ